MPVELSLVVANPNAIRTAYDLIKVYRSATLAGVYAEITDGTSRIPILADQISYPFIDPAGLDTNYYRISYFNHRTGAESAQSDPIQGQTNFALEILSVAELKANFLFGVDLTDDRGDEYPESMFTFYIQSAVSYMEMALDIPLRPLTVTNERHDFRPNEFQQFQMIQTFNKPIISVEAVRLVLPANQTIYTYPATWVYVGDPMVGIIEIVPDAGSLVLPVFSGVGSLLFSQFGGTRRYVPGIHSVDYTAGFARGQVPFVVRELVGKFAAMGPLNIAGDLIAGAGIQSYSLSLDGLGQSVTTSNSATNSGYGARLIQYHKEIKEVMPTVRRYFQGIPLRVA